MNASQIKRLLIAISLLGPFLASVQGQTPHRVRPRQKSASPVVKYETLTTSQKVAFEKSLSTVIAERAKTAYPEDGLTEYVLDRRVAYGHLDGDGYEDAAVSYVLGGDGTRSVTELMVFKNRNGTLSYITGFAFGEFLSRESPREGVLKYIQDGKIVCDVHSWAKGDAHCCPSLRGRIRLALSGNELKELR